MDDRQIVELYWQRSEQAISETASKYGRYCYTIALHILHSDMDAEESVNDTWVDAWNSMPPHRPSVLSSFLGKITRRISIDKWRRLTAEKRGGGEFPLAMEELEECLSDCGSVEQAFDRKRLSEVLNRFVLSLPTTEQKLFLCRYWYMESVKDIGKRFGFSESKVKSILFRLRGKLRDILWKEGFQ